MRGVIIWEGRSRLDGSTRIGVLLTGLDRSTRNRKTGAMLQAWVLVRDAAPHEAMASGEDAGVCGDCPLRRLNGTVPGLRTCYVNPMGPVAVWKSWRAGDYPQIKRSDISDVVDGRPVRLGAYGDPAAAPVWVWESITQAAARWTGYTHAWRRPQASGLRGLVQASVETEADAREARATGWRTFRVCLPGEEESRVKPEIWCPAARMGGRVTCSDCGLCDGRRADVVIGAHGTNGATDRFERLLAALESAGI